MSYFEADSFRLANAGERWNYSNSADVLRFEVRAGDNYSGDALPGGGFDKERSEISSDKHLNYNRAYTIDYQFMIEPGAPNTAEWVVIGQFHQTEDANDVPGASPPFAVMLRGEELVFVARGDDDPVSSGVVPTVQLNEPIPIDRGVWYDLEIQIRFDYRDPAAGNAFVKVYLNGELVVDVDDIAIGYNDAIGPYWQMGVYRESANETLVVNYRNFNITSAEPPPDIVGKEGVNDTLIAYGWESEELYGLSGNDWLDGKQRADRMFGGTGNDTYVVDEGRDVVTELTNEGVDTIKSYASYTLGNNVENLDLWGAGNLNGVGNSLSNSISGNNDINSLSGGGGNDSLFGYEGNDVLDGDADNDYITAGGGSDRVIGDLGDDRLYGEAGADNLDGGDGNDSVYGGADGDTLKGGNGLDYLQGDAGNDSIDAGAGDDKLYGLDGNDSLAGGSGKDRLEGGTGADQMWGGEGDDTYTVDNVGDRVNEANIAASFDTVTSSVTFSIAAAFVENLSLTGTANINGTGNNLDNTLSGNSGANFLAGAAGVDTIHGNAGNDNVDGGTGNDRVYGGVGSDVLKGGADADYLQGDTENDTIDGGAGDDRLYGNDGVDTLYGGTEIDRLDGGAGGDMLKAGDGNDNLYAGADNDFLYGGNGLDYMQGDAGNDKLWGEADDDRLYGNDGTDTLDGGTGNDRLDGGTGADTMAGGEGNDTYTVDNAGDGVWEGNIVGSVDLINSSVTHSIASNFVENLTLTGTANINATGNNLANSLNGNQGANVLIGGVGIDRLSGKEGNDTFAFRSLGESGDFISDFTSNDRVMGNDVIQLENSGFGPGVGTGSAANAGVDLVFGTSARSTNETLMYNQANGQLMWDANGTGSGGLTIICTLTTKPLLVADDFVFI